MKYILRDYYLKFCKTVLLVIMLLPCHRFTASILLPSKHIQHENKCKIFRVFIIEIIIFFLAIDDNEVEVTPKYTLSWFINKDVCHYFQLKVYTCSQKSCAVSRIESVLAKNVQQKFVLSSRFCFSQ